jgi:propionate CoA-transferase
VGLRTFIDPRQQGGKLNSVTTEDLVEVLDIGGEESILMTTWSELGSTPRAGKRRT